MNSKLEISTSQLQHLISISLEQIQDKILHHKAWSQQHLRMQPPSFQIMKMQMKILMQQSIEELSNLLMSFIEQENSKSQLNWSEKKFYGKKYIFELKK